MTTLSDLPDYESDDDGGFVLPDVPHGPASLVLRALVPGDRQLDDAMIHRLIERDGVIGAVMATPRS